MNSSWNFPAQAKPSYEGSELSRAKPSWGTLILRAENELDFFLIYSFFGSNIFFSTPKNGYFKKKQYYLQQNRVKMQVK